MDQRKRGPEDDRDSGRDAKRNDAAPQHYHAPSQQQHQLHHPPPQQPFQQAPLHYPPPQHPSLSQQPFQQQLQQFAQYPQGQHMASMALGAPPGQLMAMPGAPGGAGHDVRRSLFVGNLSPFTSDGLLYHIFATCGPVQACRIIKDKNGESQRYGFVDYVDPALAEHAMQVLNGRLVFGCAINCNWAAGTMNAQAMAGVAAAATAAPGMPMAMGQESHQLFVGNLSSDVDDNALYRAFSPFKSICEARVVKDTDGSSRCYGFVSFRNQADAEQAMVQMNGEWLGKRAIRVNSARNKGAEDGVGGGLGDEGRGASMAEVSAQSESSNTTVYIGGLTPEVTDWHVRQFLEDVGRVVDVRIHEEKAFAFVTMGSHEDATRVIVEKNNQLLCTRRVKVQWAKPSSGNVGGGMGAPPLGDHPPPPLSAGQRW